MALTQTQVSELYVTLMGRASEGTGNVWWQTNYEDTTAAAAAMLASDAVSAYFGTALDTDADFVAHIYENTLNKTVDGAGGTIADPDGIAYWTGRLDGSTGSILTRAELMNTFIETVKNIQATAPTAASQQFTNRVATSDYTADTLTTAPADYATSLAFQPGGLEVTDDAATVTAAQSAVDHVVAVETANAAATTAADDAAAALVANDDAAAALVAAQAAIDADDGADAVVTAQLALDLAQAQAAADAAAADLAQAQAAADAAAADAAAIAAGYTDAAAQAAAIEAQAVAVYNDALTAHNAAVATAIDSQAAADAAAADVSTQALAQAAKDLADAAKIDADATVVTADALVAAAADTADTEDDVSAAAEQAAANDRAAAADATAADAADTVLLFVPATHTIEVVSSSVTEGNTVDFTVTADHAINVDQVVNYQIQGVATTAATAADPISDLGQVNGQVIILAGETTATITISALDNVVTTGNTEGYEAFTVSLLDDTFNVASTSATVTITDALNSGQQFTLTAGVDDANSGFTGGLGNDTYNATDTTLTALDYLDGGAGDDVLNLNTLALVLSLPSATVKNIETLNLQSAASFAGDVSGYTGLTTANVTLGAANLALTAATTTDVNVAGVAGIIGVNGGKDISVTDSNAGQNITIGAATVNAGTVTVTDTKQGSGNIAVDGGTDVTVNATTTLANSGAAITAGTIIVGATTAASSDVKIVDTLNSDATDSLTGGNITVTGGATVDVTIAASQNAKDATATGNTLTNGNVVITADNSTSSVIVTQTYSETEIAASTTGNITETASVKFGALKSGDLLNVNGLKFTAAKDLTAAEVAAAFANLITADTQSNGGVTTNGIYTGALTGWTSAAANADTVVFTSTTANSNVGDLAATLTNTSGSSVAPVVTTTDGAIGTTTAATTNSGAFGAVVVNDNATASVTTMTIDGYGSNATLGGVSSLDALTDLTLKNANGGTATLTTAQTALNLNVDNVNAAVSLDGTANITTLNLTSSGTASTFALTAAALTNLTINAAANINLSGSANANLANATLQSATITGAGTVNLGTTLVDDVTLNSFDASANTGGVTATVETDAVAITGNITEYKFSDGADTVTLVDANAVTTTLDTSVSTNAGDDTVSLFAGVTGFASGITIDAGAGTADTLAMDAADLTAATGGVTFQDGISNFERVTVGVVTTTDTVLNDTLDLANLDNISYVNVSGVIADSNGDATDATDAASLSISNLAANGTVNLTSAILTSTANAASTAILSIALADDTGTSDVLNLMMSNTVAITNTGAVVANDIETINITAASTVGIAHTLILSADSATTINVDGHTGLTFSYADTALTLIDASNMTGVLTATATNDSQTIKGGSANDILSATGSQDTLLGGAGNDTLVGGDLTTLTGGAGADTFFMAVPTNVNSYATITDASAGDVIDLDSTNVGTVVFTASAVTLASTAVFQDYANAAVNALGTDTNDAAWFNYGGNTYIVQSSVNHVATHDFQNGSDSIIELAGVIDLTAASYNQDYGTLELA